MEITKPQVEVSPLDIAVTASNSTEIQPIDNADLNITVNKKEYKIVGDEVYIAKLYDDAPQWMKDLVQLVVNNTVTESNLMLLNDVIEQMNQFATSYVPLNQYTQSVLDLSNADASMHALIETINSNFNNGLDAANAQIIDLETTKASKDEVIATVLTTIAAQLSTPTSDLGATIANLQQAITTGDSANASSIQTLMSSLEGEVDARATAVSALTTRVTSVENVNTAQATAITNLATEVNNGTNTWASADSSVVNSLTTTINNGDATVQAKWAYNSTVAIDGVYKKSGFGLTSNYSGGSGTVNDPYLSEFWIDATKLKFTNSNATGRTAPFTIDASGTTPQITFNGKVSFSNVTGAPGGGSNLLYNSAPKLGNETKGWDIGWYNTSIVPSMAAGFDPWRPTGGGSVYAAVSGAPTVGSVFDLTQTTLVPVVANSYYEASAYVSAHRCNSYVTIAWFDSNNTYITEVGGSSVNTQGSSGLVNWSRSTLLAQAPSNAASAKFYVRSLVNSTDPYCSVAFAYLGKAVQGQVVFSDWSEGTSAGASKTSELTNDSSFTTLSAVASQGYVLPAGVAYAINTNTTTIDGSKITTGSVTADKIVANSISTNQLAVGTGIVNGYVQSSDFTTIGGAGFRLKSNAAGTNVDPSIYGAYIRGGTIDGSLITGQFIDINSTYILNPAYPNVSGRFTMAYSVSSQNSYITLFGPSYLSGYLPNRIISNTQEINCTAYANVSNVVGGQKFAGTVTLYRKINDGAAVALDSKSGGYLAIGGGGTFIMLSFNDLVNTYGVSKIEYYYTLYTSNATISSSSLVVSTQNMI